MERKEKIILGISILAVAGLVGWAIYAGTKKSVDELVSESEPLTVKSDTQNPDGSYTRTYSDGSTKKITKEQLITDVKKAISGRGADGSVSWSRF